MQRILLVGSGFSGLTEYLRARDYDYIILKDQINAKNPDKKIKHRALCDFSSEASIYSAVDSLPHIDAVMCVYEHYILPASLIANHLGLPGLPRAAAEACTDKFTMRGLFSKGPKQISPDYKLVRSEDDLRDFASNHSFPLILKPANLAKSLLVSKNDSLQELLTNYQRTSEQIGSVYERYAPHSTPKLLVEEFLEGSIHSVDAFIDSSGEPFVLDQIVDYRTGYDIGFADNFHYSRILPSTLSPADQIAFRECAALGAKALGMKNSPAHIEIIMTQNGPRIVEIGARNGGYRERMYQAANGIDINGAALALALGQKPRISAARDDSCAVLELFPKQPGDFAGLSCGDELQKLPSFMDLHVKVKEGDFVGKALDGYKMCAMIMLHNSDHDQFQKDLDFVDSHVRVQTT
jgi:biotin carboxylase